MDLLRIGFKMIAYMLVISFLILGVAAAAVVPFSLDRFLAFHHIWLVLQFIPLVFAAAFVVFFVIRKLAGRSDERSPKSILELARLRPLAAAGSENMSDVVSSSPETWLDVIWKTPPSHAKGATDDYLAALPHPLEEAEPPTPYDAPPPSPPPDDASCYVPSAPAYHPVYDDIPPSPVHTWYDVPSSPAPYNSDLSDVNPSPAACSWYDVPSSPEPYSPIFCDVPSSPAAYSWYDVPSSPATYSWYDVPSSPAAYSWYDVPSSPAANSSYDVPSVPELFQPEIEKNVAEPWDQYKPLFDRYWNDVPSPHLTNTADAASTNFSYDPWPPEVRKEMVPPCSHGDDKSIDETWNSIVDGGRSAAKSLRRHHRHGERGHAPTTKKAPKRVEITSKKEALPAATRREPQRAEITSSSREIVAAATRKEPQGAPEISSSKEVAVVVGKKGLTKTLKKEGTHAAAAIKETGWRRRDMLMVDKEDQDELFQRAESLIKKHYDHLRLQRQQSVRRRLLEKLRWTS